MSTIIKLRCVDQVLAFDSTPLIASGGVEEDRVEVDFCPKWDGLIKTATFWRNEADAFHVLLDEDDSCAIPKEVLIDEGSIYLGFFGVSPDGKQRTSQVLRYNVVKGAITTDAAPDAPTADLYTQLLAKYLEMVGIAAEVKTDQETFEQELTEKVERDQKVFEQEIEELIAAGLLPDDSVATAKLKDGAVTTAKLGAGAVTSEKLAQAVAASITSAANTAAEAKTAAATAQSTANGRARLEFGSYVGTGTHGQSNPTGITFSFEPKVVIIRTPSPNSKNNHLIGAIYMRGMELAYNTSYGSGSCFVYLTWSGNRVQWYTTSGHAGDQCNHSGATYYYAAFA